MEMIGLCALLLGAASGALGSSSLFLTRKPQSKAAMESREKWRDSFTLVGWGLVLVGSVVLIIDAS